MSVRGGRGTTRLWVAGALLLLLLPLLPLPTAPAQATADPWWGPSDRAQPTQGWAIRVPVVVQNTNSYPMTDAFVAAEIDFAKLLVEAGWTNQSVGASVAPRGFNLSVDSIRVVPYSPGFAAGPLGGGATQPIPHRFYPALFEEARYRPFDASRAAGTVLFQIPGELRPDEKRSFYVYANPEQYTDTPAPGFPALDTSPLDAFLWGTRGHVSYGYNPLQEGQDHALQIYGVSATLATVTVSTYELGRYVPLPASSEFPNPFPVFMGGSREFRVPGGKAFRVESTAPVVVASRGTSAGNFQEIAGWVPGRSGSFADDAFDVYGWRVNPTQGMSVMLVKASPGTVTVTSSAGRTVSLTPSTPYANILIPSSEWTQLTSTGGKFLVNLQRAERDTDDDGLAYPTHQIPATTGGPAGTEFYTYLQPEEGFVEFCADANATVRVTDESSGGEIQIIPEGARASTPPKLLLGGRCERIELPVTTDKDSTFLATSTRDTGFPTADPPVPVRLIAGAGTRLRENGEINRTRGMIGQFYGGVGGVDYWVNGERTGLFGHYNGTRLTIYEEKLRDGVPYFTNRTLGLERDGYAILLKSADGTGRFHVVGTKPFAAASLDDAQVEQEEPGFVNDETYNAPAPYVRYVPGRPLMPKIDVGRLDFRGPLVDLRSPAKAGSSDFVTTGPGSPVGYRLDVLNLGRWLAGSDLTDTITISCAAPLGWTVEGCNKDVTLRSNSAERLDLVVTPSVDDVDKLLPVEITARSKAGGAAATFTLRVKVSIVYGVGMWFDVEGGRKTIDPPIGLDPGETYRYTVVLKNTGSTRDTIVLTADPAEEGWTQRILQGSSPATSLELDGGESTTLVYEVTAPAQESARPNLVSIVAQSRSSALAADVVNAATRIRPKVDLDLTLAPQTRLAAPNETATFDLTLCNKGNDIFTIYLSQDSILPKGWTANFSTDRIGNELTLNRNPGCADPRENITVQLFVTPPEGARAGDLASAKIAAEIDTGGAGGRVAGDEVSAVVVVRRIFNLTTPPIPDVQAMAGRDLRLVLPVQNAGNGQVEVELLPGAVEAALLATDGSTRLVGDWDVELETPDVTLGLNETTELTFLIEVPRGTPPGLYDLTFTTRLSREAVHNLTVPIDVRAVAALDLDVPDRVAFTPGRLYTVPFVAENEGNVEALFELSADAPDGWNVTLSPPRVRVAPGESVDLVLAINVTREADAGTYRVLLRAAAEGHTPTLQDLTVSLARPELRLGDVSANGALRPGELVLVTATVANGGGIAAENVSVALLVDGRIVDSVTLSRIPVGSSSLATLSWVSTQRGGDVRVVVDPAQEIALAERGAASTEATVQFGSFLGTPFPVALALALAIGLALARRRRSA